MTLQSQQLISPRTNLPPPSDTPHTKIPYYTYPDFFQANASFSSSTNSSSNSNSTGAPLAADATVDLIFLDFIVDSVLAVLASHGLMFTESDVSYYLPANFTTNSYLPVYAQMAPAWQANVPNCPVGLGIGYNSTT